jgi:dipeptidyl aminopeptidase/acylaminoacyl peptidase
MKKLFTVCLVVCFLNGFAQDAARYQRPPQAIADLIEAPSTPAVLFSPDRTIMVFMDRSDYPTIEELSRPELRIAGLRINPDNFGQSRNSFFVGLKIKAMKDIQMSPITNLPSPLQISNFQFSPDSKKAAFLQTFPDRLELWVVDFVSLSAKKISARKVNNTIGNPFSWLSNSSSLLYLAASNEGRTMPAKSRVPLGPVVEENLGKKAPNRTYQDLLKNPYDESLFDHYCTSQLTLVSSDGVESAVGKPAIYLSQSPSPDARYILTKEIQRPYSYLVPASLFPQSVDVVTAAGALVKHIASITLADNVPIGFSSAIKGARIHTWRNDVASTLYWAEAQDGGDPKVKAEVRDKVFQWAAPFANSPTELVSLPLRYGGISWGNDKVAWVYESWWADRKQRVYQIDPSAPGTRKTVFDFSSEDAYADPGSVVSTINSFGKSVMLINNNAAYLTGDGASPEGDRPFLDRIDLTTGKVTRQWRSEAPYYEFVVAMLDAKKGTVVTSRESQSENPNYFVRTLGSKDLQPLTSFPHPYPQLKEVKKQVLKYKREDGVELTADLYLPPNYKEENGPLPTFFWAYPEEFKSKSNAGQVKGSPHTFTRLSWGSPIYWVLRGYAILDNASIPIVGEGEKEPNDTYVQQLVSSAKAAIDYGASLGVVDSTRVAAGGHSYGAFMTGNLLAHSDLFRAGIARSGAYNRTLTPFGFQSEERTYWQAPQVYYEMSPFSYADKIKEPILMIHGEADNNTGTFPIQSERMYNAIKGHGGTARFVLLPYESHGYRGKESVMHMFWEMDTWLERYVKGPKETPPNTKVDMKN